MRCSKSQIVLDELGMRNGKECLFFLGFYAARECDEYLEPLAKSSRRITTRGDEGLEEEDRRM